MIEFKKRSYRDDAARKRKNKILEKARARANKIKAQKRKEFTADRCFVCGAEHNLVSIRTGSTLNLCAIHYTRFLEAFHRFVDEQRSIIPIEKEMNGGTGEGI